MLVVLSFHSLDKAQAVSLANWIRELGQVSDHKCLLCIGENCDEKGVIEPLHECFKSTSVYLPHAKAKRGQGLMGYARAANAMWQSVAWKIYMQDKCPWLWLEPDSIPTRPTWLNEISHQYDVVKKKTPFMGAMGQCQIPMINGVAVYPPNVCDYAPLALQAAECPWDLNAAAQILKHAHVSDLFQHIYQINGEPPTFPRDKDRLNQSAALFHRCKDDSLIAHLKQVGYTTGKAGDASCRPNQTSLSTGHIGNAAPIVQPAGAAPLRGIKTGPVVDNFDQADEGLGEPVDYSKRLQEFESSQTRPRRPNEGERNGDLVWRGGKWHTAPMATEKPDRKAVMEKFKHPQPAPEWKGGSDSPTYKDEEGQERWKSGLGKVKRDLPAPGTDDGPSNVEVGVARRGVDDGPKTDTGAVQPSRDDLVQEAVSVLKKLCTSPVHTSKIRKELKRQKVIK